MGQCLTRQDTRPSGVGNPCSRIRGQYDDGIKFHRHTRKNDMGDIIGISVAVALIIRLQSPPERGGFVPSGVWIPPLFRCRVRRGSSSATGHLGSWAGMTA